jgi:outer membrane receptor for ferrienterochelin and colicin
MKQLSLAALAAVFLVALPVASNAQETSADMRGMVTDESGNPVPSAAVTIRNDSTGLTRSTTSAADGGYVIRNLPVGQEVYSMTVDGEGFASARRSGVSIILGGTATQDFALSTTGEMEEILVFGTQQSVSQVAVGPTASFGLEALQAAPAINRNIADVLRIDPRIHVDESRGGINAVQCAGKNSRYNSLTVDGVRMNDAFGLNSNGYPTERMPFSYDAINQVAVELAPFDVVYGGFSACNINAVTKSGSNEWFGGAFYDYTSDSLRGDSLEGDSITSGSYDESRYGVNFGGPIIKDKLFFFVAAEMLDGANLFDRGAIGSGAVNEVLVSQFELDEVARIANEVYQYDVGFIPESMDHSDEKLLLKFDWNFNDTQRLAYTYIYNDGENFSQSDSAQDEIEFSNHIYERGAELNSHAATLYSDWTDRFSTEIRFGYSELDNRQISVGGTDFGEMRIELDDVDVYIGGDDSRQSNKLKYDTTTFALRGKYDLDDHALTFGYELESLSIFNLFIQHTETELRFNGLADFEAQFADDVYYNNSPAHNPSDAAAVWGYDVNTLYVQDEFMIGDRLLVVAGIRHDWYTTSDAPALNTDFQADYGFGNNQTLDGESLTQPRLGLSYELSDSTTLTGGVGMYSGGNPNVWLSNTYSNDNTRQFGAYRPDYDLTNEPLVACESGVPTRPGWCIPQMVYDDVTTGSGSNFELNYLDPNFSIPSELKLALGVEHITQSEWILRADFLYSESKDSAMVMRGDLEETGRTPEGYPIYDSVRMPSFVLTNSNRKPKSTVLSFGVEKLWDWDDDSLYLRFGYANTSSEDVQPMTSSVSFSNYTNRAFFDPQEDVVSTSNYEIKDRFTFATRWIKRLGRSTDLTVALYGLYESGAPFSYAFNGTVDPYNFTPFLDFQDNVLEPGDARNGQTGSSWKKLDMKVSLDFPGFSDGHHAQAFMVIDNLTNLLNDEWGVMYKHNFPFAVSPGTSEARIGDASRYEIRFGVRYDFD